MTAQLTIEDVQIHHAVTTFQRDPERPLPYRRLDRWRDWLAGWSDRPQLAGVRGETPDTPWLQQLGQECRTRLEAERRGTLAVVAAIDAAIVGHRRRIGVLLDELAALGVQREEQAAIQPDAIATTAAEELETAEQRGRRRTREHRAALAAMDEQVRERGVLRDEARVAIDTLLAARQWHWTVLLVRGHHLLAHYNRRCATYVRALVRRAERGYDHPVVPAPDWLSQESPPPIPSVPSIAGAVKLPPTTEPEESK